MTGRALLIASTMAALLAGTGAASADCWRYDGSSGAGSQRQAQIAGRWGCGYYGVTGYGPAYGGDYAYDAAPAYGPVYGGYYDYGMAPPYGTYGYWGYRRAGPPGGVIQDRAIEESNGQRLR
jgi:hypothetical protein